MKRVGNLYNEIASYENCVDAVRNASAHKKKRNTVGSVVFDVSTNKEYYGKIISDMLTNKTFVPSEPNHFFVYEGYKRKKREIFAPNYFPDQIVHWAVMQKVSPIFTKSFYDYSCGSIPGRGPAKIKKYLERELSYNNPMYHTRLRGTYKYCLKLDIHHFFQSINRDILMDLLKRKIKDKDLLDLLEAIIYTKNSGTGLPIGYYTSQWLANFYLDGFDHWLVDELAKVFKKFIFIRYVDDIVIVASNKRFLARILDSIKTYLRDRLDLRLKYDGKDQIFNIGKRPIDFVGFKFTYNKTTVRNSIYERAMKKERYTNKTKYNVNNLSSIISYNGWLGSSDCHTTVRKNYKYPISFYKEKLKIAKKSPEFIALMNSYIAMNSFKRSIHDMVISEYNRTGDIVKVRTTLDSNGNLVTKIVDRMPAGTSNVLAVGKDKVL